MQSMLGMYGSRPLLRAANSHAFCVRHTHLDTISHTHYNLDLTCQACSILRMQFTSAMARDGIRMESGRGNQRPRATAD